MKSRLIKLPPKSEGSAAVFETVLGNLHETIRGETIAFEVVAQGQNIAFCFTASDHMSEVIAGQIYAVVPDAEIVEIDDFTTVKNPQAQFIGAEIALARNDLFPLKTHSEFQGSSLGGLLSVLSQCTSDESVIFQLTLSPVRDSAWHHLKLNIRKRLSSFRNSLRIKYWFKKGVTKTFKEKIGAKVSGRLFLTNIRVGVLSEVQGLNPELRCRSVLAALSHFNTLDLNQLQPVQEYRKNSQLTIFERRALGLGFLLSVKEVATLYHLPPGREVPNAIQVVSHKEAPPPRIPTDRNDAQISFFGHTNFRDQRVPFGIRYQDRRRHCYILGKSGMGKSKLLEQLVLNDIRNGKGVGVIDPHGDLVDNILKSIPRERIKDVVLFDPSDLEFPPAFNPLAQVPEELKLRVTIGFLEIFKKLFSANWTSRLEHVLRYTTLALLANPGSTVLSILKLLTNKRYRQGIVANIQDNVVKNFWVNEFASWSERFDQEAITPLLNKVGQFVATNMVRNIVGQQENLFDFRSIMDSKKILLMKISKGLLGEENAALLGAMIVTKLYQAALSRADVTEEKRVDYYLYVDEFHNFATDTFDEILSEARKYRLNLTVANQFLGQLNDKMRTTVFGNVGSVISFRVGSDDAALIAKEFSPRFADRDLINLGVREFCVKMSVDGEIKEAFSGRTLDAPSTKSDFSQACVAHSRSLYARPLKQVQAAIEQWEQGESEGPHGQGASKIIDDEFEEPII